MRNPRRAYENLYLTSQFLRELVLLKAFCRRKRVVSTKTISFENVKNEFFEKLKLQGFKRRLIHRRKEANFESCHYIRLVELLPRIGDNYFNIVKMKFTGKIGGLDKIVQMSQNLRSERTIKAQTSDRQRPGKCQDLLELSFQFLFKQ